MSVIDLSRYSAVSARCLHCGEEVRPDEPARDMPVLYTCGAHEVGRVHRECFFRMTVGSVGHQRGECSCFGGTTDDPEGMSPREAARAAYDLFIAQVGRQIMMTPFVKGDRVRITFDDRTVDGVIAIASPNGRSLFLSFDAVLGVYAGGLPCFDAGGDGVYRDLATSQIVKVEKVG